MIKNCIYIFSFCVLIASCAVGRKSAKNETAVPASANGKMAVQNEMNAFIDAETARLIGDNNRALQLYSAFLIKYPRNATAYYNIAKIYFHQQEIVTALKNAEKAMDINPANKYFQELYTQLLVYNNDTRDAEKQYNTLISKNPESDEYIYKKAMLFVKAKEYDKALKTLNQLEKKIGFNEDVIMQKKSLYQRMNKTDEAIAELKKLRDADPSAVQYTIMMIDVYETGKQMDKAKAVYDELESAYPNEPLAQVALAQYFLENKNTARYHVFMQKVMKNKNLDADTKMSLIGPLYQTVATDTSGEREEIIELARLVAEESPENKEVLEMYGDVLFLGKKYDEALGVYKNILRKDRSVFKVWEQIITIYSDKMLHDSVLAYASESAGLFPNNPLPYFFMGYSYLQKKEPEKACIPLNKAVDLEPENPNLYAQVYSCLGEAYNATKNYAYSDSCFEQALAILPDDATTLNNFAYYLSLRKQKLEQAERMSKRSLELMPGSKSFLDTYGWILFQQGKYADAKSYIEQAIAAGGEEDGTLYDHLGDIYFKMNDTDKAIEHWNKAKAKGENTPLLNRKIKDRIWYDE